MIQILLFFFFLNDTATTEIYTLPLHDALPISLCTQQTSRDHEDCPGREDCAVRARCDVSRRIDIRPAVEWALVDGLHRATGLRRLSCRCTRVRQIDATAGDGIAAGAERANCSNGYSAPRLRHSRGLHPQATRCAEAQPDRKSTRLNSSHSQISYAVFCLKKKN